MKIYQLKITLKGFKPPIWRRVEVPSDFTFADLHKVIQVVMDWTDSHLHHFRVEKKETGKQLFDFDFIEPIMGGDDIFPAMDGSSEDSFDEEEESLEAWFKKEKDKVFYTYDFGDSWEHEILLEKVLERDPEVQYPRCTAARRLTPDEDSRGEVIEAIEEYGRWAEKEDPRPKDLAKVCHDDLQYIFSTSQKEEG